MGYKEDININESDLQLEVLKHSSIYLEYQEERNIALKNTERLKIAVETHKDRLKNVESELYLKYKNTKTFDGKIPTEQWNNLRIFCTAKREKFRRGIK